MREKFRERCGPIGKTIDSTCDNAKTVAVHHMIASCKSLYSWNVCAGTARVCPMDKWGLIPPEFEPLQASGQPAALQPFIIAG